MVHVGSRSGLGHTCCYYYYYCFYIPELVGRSYRMFFFFFFFFFFLRLSLLLVGGLISSVCGFFVVEKPALQGVILSSVLSDFSSVPGCSFSLLLSENCRCDSFLS
jgi:hypothetical protein